MPAVASIGLPVVKFVDANNRPAAGGSVTTYLAGTTTLAPTYTDATGTTSNPNPLHLNLRGECEIWFDRTLQYDLAPSLKDGTALPRQNGLSISTATSDLQARLAVAASGSGLIGYQSAAAGSVARTLQDREDDMESVFNFMTKAQKAHVVARDGLFDCTAALNAAHATGKLVDYGEGSLLISGPINIAQGGIRGRGRGVTRIYSTNAGSNNLITYTGSGGASQVPIFADFHIESGTTKSGGAALAFTPVGTELQYARISGISTYNIPTGVDLNACTFGQMSDCVILNYSAAGLKYSNTVNGGSGDFLVSGNHFGTAASTGTRYGILQTSGGGLRVIGNKVLGGRSAFVLAYDGTPQSGPLLINGNSFENYLEYGVFLGSTGGLFGGIVIGENEFAGPNGIVTDTLGRLLEVLIAPNYFTAITTQGISLTDVADFSIASQLISGGGSSALGIGIAAGCTNGKIARQVYKGLAQNIRNLSTNVVTDPELQTGSATVTTNSAYGSVYIGYVDITFATPFATTPIDVDCRPLNSAQGAISAFASVISTIGFRLNLVGVTNNVATACSWAARGAI